MAVIAFIEDEEVIKKILKHLGLCGGETQTSSRMAKTQPLHTEPHIDYSDTQVRPSDNGFYMVDPIYPADYSA